ncbi:hypothetical protein CHU32_19160 [Superficieibacter electus]|uniref:Uncharacterized protein n=1 Tax=Superficieibacter electus TaxID=2022662 RepID=A0A2P5GLA4_9ENTR|nr:hypothetical protein CHU33_18785 [Superficieibacter electus]POP45802.1 hypothetical protein CHU32_19160 [Superficieibacter electus]
MAGSSMPVNGHRLMSVRCLVTGEYAELKRQDGLSDEPGIFLLLTGSSGYNKICLKRSQN